MAYVRGVNLNNKGLIFSLDSRNSKSYSGSGSDFINLTRRNRINATLNNSPSRVSNAKFSMDGSDDWISFPQNPDLDNVNFTINLWVKFSSLSSSFTIFQYGNGLTSTKGIIVYYDSSSNTIRFSINTASTNFASYSFNNTSVVNLTFTYDGSNLKIYENASLKATQSETARVDYVGVTGGSIFAMNGGYSPATGEFHSIQIYDRALSQAEIKVNSKAILPGINMPLTSAPPVAPSPSPTPVGPTFVTDNLIGWWDSEEWDPATQDRVPDLAYENNYSTQDHSLVASNGATKVSVDGTSALYTDGVNDRFGVNRQSIYGTSDLFYVPNLRDYTVELWFRSNGSFISNGNLWNATYNGGTRCRFSSSGTLWIYPKTHVYPGFSASTNTWYHLTITMENNGTSDYMKTYVDGTLIDTATLNYNPSENSAAFILGTFTSSSERGRFYFGPIRRYNVALTSTEVTQNYNAEKTRFGHS